MKAVSEFATRRAGVTGLWRIEALLARARSCNPSLGTSHGSDTRVIRWMSVYSL